jgi:hypothetical protein
MRERAERSSGWGHGTFWMAELRVGLGAEDLAPNSRFIARDASWCMIV